MKESVKEQWLTALRSGNYKQGRNALREDDTFCCLGVLCDLAVKNKVIPEPNAVERRRYDGNGFHLADVYEFAEEDMFLPAAVREWAGIEAADPNVDTPIEEGDGMVIDETPLSKLNDDGHSFADIADLIEDQM